VITGMDAVLSSPASEKVRAFSVHVLGMPSAAAGSGWHCLERHWQRSDRSICRTSAQMLRRTARARRVYDRIMEDST
jgi:hypothetical protein